jgi:hypothetical protein
MFLHIAAAPTLFLLFCPLNVFAQGVVFPVPGIQPSPLIRLTGVLEPASEPQASILPALTVWIKGERRTFRVEKVESAIAAYKGQDHLKKVSLLGLRLIGRESLLALLQSKERQGQTLVIEGWLRAKAGVLRVRSVGFCQDGQGYTYPLNEPSLPGPGRQWLCQ